jgi:photosystem II stability/assembly factor-like uncharacterized protein
MVRDIAIDPGGTSDQIIYIATDNGGIWKSIDGGTNWVPKTDFMPSLSMGAVALDPGNPSIVYAGTGNYQNSGFYKGVGIYKSVNGGDSWTIPAGNSVLTNQPTGYSTLINRMVLPAPGVLLIATFTFSKQYGLQGGGVFKSVDGGEHFGNNKPNFDNGRPVLSGAVWDVSVDTLNPSVAYASVTGQGVFKSSDQGTSFPTNLFSPNNGAFTANDGSTTTMGFIAFAQSTYPDNQTMYANVQLTSGGPTMTCSDGTHPPGSSAMLRSTDGGRNWTYITLNGDIRCSYQIGFDQTIGVDPQDADRVFIGMRALYMATDGGRNGLDDSNRIDLNKVHPDQHALVFSPPSHRTGPPPTPTRFYNGTDGGIATNPDGGTNNWQLLNGNPAGPGALATILFRRIDIGRGSTANNGYVYGTAQDNGLSSRTNSSGTWHDGLGGDGGAIAVDPQNPRHAYATIDDTNVYSTSDGYNWAPIVSGMPTSPNWLFFDPNGGTAYAVLNNQLYADTANGSFGVMKTFTAGNITVSAMVKADSKTIWLGLSDSTLTYTTNADQGQNATWNKALAPLFRITAALAIDPSDTGRLVIAYPQGNASLSSGNIFMTTNSGTTWANISGNLPSDQIPNAGEAVVIDPNTSPHTIIVATSGGVWATANVGQTWNRLGGGLPNLSCTSLAMDDTAIPSLLRVATYGRGAWELAYDRQYVDWRAGNTQDGTREAPFRTVSQARDAAASGDAKVILIQSGDYYETPPPFTINQCCTLMAINGSATIH